MPHFLDMSSDQSRMSVFRFILALIELFLSLTHWSWSWKSVLSLILYAWISKFTPQLLNHYSYIVYIYCDQAISVTEMKISIGIVIAMSVFLTESTVLFCVIIQLWSDDIESESCQVLSIKSNYSRPSLLDFPTL